MDRSVHQYFGKYYDVSCSKIPELLGHTFPTLQNQLPRHHLQHLQEFFRYTTSKKDMDIDMIWYNILMIFWDRGYDIISQQLARYEIWYYILEFGIFPTTVTAFSFEGLRLSSFFVDCYKTICKSSQYQIKTISGF